MSKRYYYYFYKHSKPKKTLKEQYVKIFIMSVIWEITFSDLN